VLAKKFDRCEMDHDGGCVIFKTLQTTAVNTDTLPTKEKLQELDETTSQITLSSEDTNDELKPKMSRIKAVKKSEETKKKEIKL